MRVGSGCFDEELRSTQLSARDQRVSQRKRPRSALRRGVTFHPTKRTRSARFSTQTVTISTIFEDNIALVDLFKNVLIVTVCAEKRTDLVRLVGWNVTPRRSADRDRLR